jgi:hypothetical protein
MISVKQMPTTVALILCSFLSALAGAGLGAYYFFYRADALTGICLLIAGLFLAVCVRAAANMGQIFFDMKGDNARLWNELRGILEAQNRLLSQLSQAANNASRDDRKAREDLRARIDRLAQSLQAIGDAARDDIAVNRDLLDRVKSAGEALAAVADVSEKISCDSKDINQGIQQIRSFFERIERHLDLNK